METKCSPDKIYDRCAYLNCFNGRNSTGHRLFKFPAYSDSRHNLWIRYTGNVRLRTWSSATIRRSGICADHFSSESFTDATCQRLRRYAVPEPYSTTDVQSKASSTLLDHIKSLPRECMRNYKLSESKESHEESMNRSSQDIVDPEDFISAPENPMPAKSHIVDAVKTLRKVKMIKIEEQNSDLNRLVILERCKNPETCPANRQPKQNGEKSRAHFHKVYINNTKAGKISILMNQATPSVKNEFEEAVSDMRINDKSLDESCVDKPNGCLEDEYKSRNDTRYRFERYLINVTRNFPKEVRSDASRLNENVDAECQNSTAKSMSSNRSIRNEKGESIMITIPKYISTKHPSTKELVEDYYRTKDERSFDRCAYLNCKNGKYRTGARLFRFPQSSDPRFNTWIKNAGNPKMLYWAAATIRRAGLCGDHFTDASFYNETRHRLLRNALPKPFYLDSKNVSGTKLQNEDLSREDLIRIFEGLDEDHRDGTEPALIDLPDEKLHNRENLKIKYPFEDVAVSEENVKEEKTGSFATVNIKTEPPDELHNADLSRSNEDTQIKYENIEGKEEETLLDDADFINNDIDFEQQENSDQADDIRGIIELEHQKFELCRTIKQFSTKLKKAQIRKKKLRSKLLAYRESKMV